MNQQEATRARAVSWLRAGRTVKEIMSYGDFFNKKTVVGEADLASQLTWLQPFGLICVGRLWIKVRAKPHNKTKNLILKIRGWWCPRQEHRGEHLQEVQVPDRGCRRCWWQFYWLNWFSVRSCAILFLLQWNRMVSSCAVSFKKKIRIYRCHPVVHFTHPPHGF
jgi:hypothetical protein